MKLGFEEPQTDYLSGSQRAKAWTERWVGDWVFCPNCGNSRINQLPPNLPVADFFCASCQEIYELKSQKKAFGSRIANGSYDKKCERLLSSTNPNFILLNYNASTKAVRDVFIIPKHYFVPDIVERRKPLSETARRAGWVGSNILLGAIPSSGRIDVVRDGKAVDREIVLASWRQTLFLRDQSITARGWLIEVMNCVERIGRLEFTLEDVYKFENYLSTKYPSNSNVRPKIRQQLQVLRDNEYLDFMGKGVYRLRQSP